MMYIYRLRWCIYIDYAMKKKHVYILMASAKPWSCCWWIIRWKPLLALGDSPRSVWPSASFYTWWRHQMETFSALLALCVGNSPVTGEFPSQRPVTRSFDVFFDLRLNEPLSKQCWGWWFETPSWSLWRHCNEGEGTVLQYRLMTLLPCRLFI